MIGLSFRIIEFVPSILAPQVIGEIKKVIVTRLMTIGFKSRKRDPQTPRNKVSHVTLRAIRINPGKTSANPQPGFILKKIITKK